MQNLNTKTMQKTNKQNNNTRKYCRGQILADTGGEKKEFQFFQVLALAITTTGLLMVQQWSIAVAQS